MRCQRQNERADSMTRFANPKAMQDFINQYGPEAAMGGNPKVGTRPRGTPTTGGPKPAPTVQQPADALRPYSPTRPTTGGPKPAPTGLGSAMQTKPAMANKLGSVGAALGKRLGMKKMASGGSVSSASKRADGCAIQGKTKGKMV